MRKLNNFGFSHLLVPVLVFVLLGAIGGAYLLNKSDAATPSSTSTKTTTAAVTPSSGLTVGRTTQLCLNRWPSECLRSNGPSNPVTIDTVNRSTWTILPGAPNTLELQNASGNCLTTNSAGGVTLANGQCVISNTHEQWFQTLTTPLKLTNNATNTFMGVNCPGGNITGAGEHVVTKAEQTGFCNGWAHS